MAYKTGGATSQVSLVLSTDTVLLVAGAVIFLGERKDVLIKLLAGLLAVAGVILLIT